jgi:DNA-binding transcriptional ArsR family regulator
MVQYQALDRTFSSLSDPKRRQILDRLGRGPASISELAAPLDISLTGLKKHVRILEEADFVTTEKIGRTRQCRLGPAHREGSARLGRGPLVEVDNWLESFRRMWNERYDRLDEYLRETREKEKRDSNHK